MIYEVTFSKVKGGSSVRTDVTVGHCHSLPVVGKQFEMFSEPLESDEGVRWITTSTVQNIIEETDCVLLETMNSTYKLIVK
jgi:hypothetical protein